MKASKKLEVRSRKFDRTTHHFRGVLLFSVFFLLTSHFSLLTSHAEKVYIDITSPGIRKLPIAIQPFTNSKEISDTVKNDLNFTGLFDCIEDAAQIERTEQPFNPNSWKGLGVELVVKGTATTGRGLNIVISAYDVSAGREVFRKEYSATAELSRPLSHSIANDIYKLLTGQQGIFRTKIAFIMERSGKKEIYMMDWDGHRAYSLGIPGEILLSPRWSADGRKLLYSAQRNRSWDIYLFDMNAMKERNIAMPKGLNMAGNFFPNNKEFVFTSSKNGNADIYKADIAGMKSSTLIASPWIDVSPTISPDGNRMLFVSNRSGNPQIYIADKDGNGIRRLTFEGSYNTSPVWSPQGDMIAYTSMMGGKNQIFVIKSDGTALTRLTDRGSNEDPSFSPDGRHIAFSSDRDGGKGIYIMRANGEGQIKITQKDFKATSPNWSPL